MRSIPPAWRIGETTCCSHSVQCLEHSSQNSNAKLINFRGFSAKDVANALKDQLRELGPPTYLRPSSLRPLLSNYVPPQKQLNEDYMRAFSARVLDSARGIFSHKNPSATDSFTGLNEELEGSKAMRSTYELTGLTAFKNHFEALHPRYRLIIHDQAILGSDIRRCVSSTMIFGPTVLIADHSFSTQQFEIVGAHFKKPEWASKIPGLMRGMITTDADNTTLIVAISHETREESTEAWKVFVQDAIDSISKFNLPNAGICSDRDGGLLNVRTESPSSVLLCSHEKKHRCHVEKS